MQIRLLLSLLTVSIASCMQAQENPLAKHRWEHRVILVFAPDTESTDFQQQLDILTSDSAGMKDRDLFVYHLFPKGGTVADGGDLAAETVRALRQRYRIEPSDFTTILIGKDGGEKLRTEKPLPLEKLFDTIDAMPMRRTEMRRGDR